MQAVVGLDTSTDERGPKSPDCLPGYVLQVAERSEYLDAAARLMDYEYVHECYKYDRDVVFVVVKRERMQKPYLRTVCVTNVEYSPSTIFQNLILNRLTCWLIFVSTGSHIP